MIDKNNQFVKGKESIYNREEADKYLPKKLQKSIIFFGKLKDMKFIDLQSEYQYFKKDIDTAISEVIRSGEYLFGKQLEKLETDFSKLFGKKYAIGLKNCTDALFIVLKRIEQIKGKDYPIILPNFTAYPDGVVCKNITSNIHYIDVDSTFTIDIDKLPKDIKNGVIVPVNLFGNNCNLTEIKNYADKNNHLILLDCAQSCGSSNSYDDSDYDVFSFYPTKNLSCYGDGGMILTNSKEDMEYFKKIRFYGQERGKVVLEHGVNSRMDEIQCGIINVKLNKFQKLNDARISIAERYKKIIKGINTEKNKVGIRFTNNPRCVYHQFPVLFNERDKTIKELNKREIPYMIHYPYHLPDMKPLRGKHNEVGYRINDKIISLPVHPFLKEIEIQQIEEFLDEFKGYEC